MKLSRLIILVGAAWLGTLYYQRYHAFTNVTSNLTPSDGSQIDQPGKPGIRTGNFGAVGGLGKVGKGATTRTTGGSTAPAEPDDGVLNLMEAAARGDTGKVKSLLGRQVKVDGRDHDRRTALMYASWNGHNDACARLLAAGANPRFQDRNGNNAFDYAAGRGLADTVRFLLEYTQAADNRHYLEYASLIRAAFAGDAALLPAGKGKWPSVNRLNPEQQSPLHIVAGNGSVAVGEALIRRGADPNLKNKEQQAPLHWAAWNNQPAMIDLLLKQGATLSQRDHAGNTALILAARNNSGDAARTLLARGASRHMANKEGKTAHMVAEDGGHSELAQSLR